MTRCLIIGIPALLATAWLAYQLGVIAGTGL